MDLMKVFDQAVRDIKREVNLKVLKVPEIEQKVLDATNNEPWGPHGSDLAEISQATKRFTECQMITNVLWTRLTDSGPNWRHVYKALSVIEYLVANGSERVVEDILEHSFQISSLSSFEYVEPSGKDLGINVRKKVETILSLLNDKEKMQAVRNKAAANREKYVGLSSTGITYKSSSTSYGSSRFKKNDKYGGLGGSKEDETFKDSYKDMDHYGDDNEKTQKSYSSVTNGTKMKKGTSHPSSGSKPSVEHDTSKRSSAQMNTNTDDFDDFDPRGSSTSESATTNPKQVDLLGDSFLGDLIDVETPVSREPTNSNASSVDEVDLFAGATFVSATPHTTTSSGHDLQGQFDFFAEPPSVPAFSPGIDLFATPSSGVSTGMKPSMPVTSSSDSFDPFAAVPLNIYEGSDFYGEFVSHTDSASPEQLKNSGNATIENLNVTSMPSKPGQKETFQVKSGIWADSLSRGLVDLNLTASKKVALSDVGIVGRLDRSDEKDTRHPAPLYTGRGVGAATGPSKPAYPYPTGASGSEFR